MLEIRQATWHDLPALTDQVKPAYARSFADELKDQDCGVHSIYLALRSGTVVGSGFIRWLGPRELKAKTLLPDAPEILRLTVNPEAQSQGLGTALITAMEAEARQRGLKHVSLGVAHDNPAAERLYRRLGFTLTLVESYDDEYKYQVGSGPVQNAREQCRYLVKSW